MSNYFLNMRIGQFNSVLFDIMKSGVNFRRKSSYIFATLKMIKIS